MNTEFPWAEVGLATKFGVKRGVLTSIRKGMLKEGVDWIADVKSICWTQKAAEFAAQKIGAVIPEPIRTEPVLDSPKSGNWALIVRPKPQPETLVVVRKVPNRFVLVARRVNGDEVTARVINSRNFKEGMQFKAQLAPGETIWLLVGRCPRFPGRW